MLNDSLKRAHLNGQWVTNRNCCVVGLFQALMHKQRNMYVCGLKGILVEWIQRISTFSWPAFGSLCVLPPGPPLTHKAALRCINKYPKDNSKGWQRMKMKRRVGACCASEWGHGPADSAVSQRCGLVFDVLSLEWACFFNVMQLWRWSVWSYAWIALISSFFLVCFCFFLPSPFFLWVFFIIFFSEKHKLCVWSEGVFQGYPLCSWSFHICMF